MENKPVIFDRQPVAVELEAGAHWWCSCGKSATQPFCDGSHKGSGFAPTKFELAEKTEVWLCNCKHTCDKPFCDGSHSKLPA